MENSKGTVTISIEDYEQLMNGFENSKDRKLLIDKIQVLIKEVESNTEQKEILLKADFVEIETSYQWILMERKRYYLRKDKTPLWIRKFFNR